MILFLYFLIDQDALYQITQPSFKQLNRIKTNQIAIFVQTITYQSLQTLHFDSKRYKSTIFGISKCEKCLPMEIWYKNARPCFGSQNRKGNTHSVNIHTIRHASIQKSEKKHEKVQQLFIRTMSAAIFLSFVLSWLLLIG